jgi:putative two-component system response regulator
MQGKILVIDDDPAEREMLETFLSNNGFEVFTASDGQRGLLEFGRTQPDVVLLDITMPKVNGFEVCRRLKANPDTRLTPVVLVTGMTATQDRILGHQAGADDFLSKPVDLIELLARVHSLVSLKAFTDELERAESVLFALARSIEGKDPYTEGHCERLSALSAELGEHIGLDCDMTTALRRAGVVHDVGKVAVPDAILLKPGRLTPEEFKVIQVHPIVGERICAPLRSFRLVLPVIRHHHEKLDGTGYPDGLKGLQIPVAARVLQIVDVYDALTTQRPYKAAMSSGEALQTMQDEVRKGWWDPDIFTAFVGVVTEPAGVSAGM